MSHFDLRCREAFTYLQGRTASIMVSRPSAVLPSVGLQTTTTYYSYYCYNYYFGIGLYQGTAVRRFMSELIMAVSEEAPGGTVLV